MGKKHIKYDYPLIIYNELIAKAKSKSTLDYLHLELLTRNEFSREELDDILKGHALMDLSSNKPELWVLVSKDEGGLPSDDYFQFIQDQGLAPAKKSKPDIYKIQLKKAHDYWPKRKRSGKKFR